MPNKLVTSQTTIEPGTVFGELKVGQPNVIKGKVIYDCYCTCGLSLLLPAEKLLSGRARSCNWEENDPAKPHATDLGSPDIWVSIQKPHIHLLQAMTTEGGKGITIDASFLERHGIAFHVHDSRVVITDIHHCGLIRQGKNDCWDVTPKARKWLKGEAKIRSGAVLDGEDKSFKHWMYGGYVSVDDVLDSEPTHVEP